MVTISLATGLDFEDMFDLAPVSLWMEDYSGLKLLFDQWRAEGITDLLAHLREDPQRLRLCSQSYKVLRVNQYTLDLFKAPDQQTLQSRLHEVFRGDMLDSILVELLALWRGDQGFETRSVNYALDGRRLDVQVRARVVPGYADSWSRVLVSLEDVTAEVQGREQLRVDVAGVAGLHELRHDFIEGQFFPWVACEEAQHQPCQAVGVGAVGHGCRSLKSRARKLARCRSMARVKAPSLVLPSRPCIRRR